MTIITGIFAFIFILGAAVVLHEFGHFLVAKLFKIRVETFSVGFGPRLFGRKWGQTDYRVSAIPLAGAVIYGVPATPAPVINSIASGGASEAAGLQRGDRIISFNGTDLPKWDTIRGDALLSPGEPLPVVVERNGQRIQLMITPVPHTEDGETAGILDFLPDYGNVPVIVREVTPNSPAAEAGLQPGDQILTIAGQPVHSAEQVTQFISEHKGEPITLHVKRDGREMDITATARKLSDGKERLGFGPTEEPPLIPVGLGGATRYAVETNLEILRLTGKALGQFFTGQRSARNTLSGPVGIYKAASSSVERYGWGGLFTTLAFLSLNLGIFNLLPIPVLDGGAIFLLLVEGLLATIGMTLSMRVRDRIQQVGFVMVLLLMVFVLTNDFLKTFTRSPNSTKPAVTTPGK